MLPERKTEGIPQEWQTLFYEKQKDILVRDYTYQLVFDFTNSKAVSRHFKSLGAFEVVNHEI